ncbi:MAG: XRE family transcriptional regulator [Alphaproteobacteria bacterium]|jgi:putative transcriptional regulator|nr:XRE family transcriptional regulator [Alphaproteobacteria bacterium]
MNNIKQLRKNNNISVSKLAEEIGMSQANLTKIENNQVELKIDLAQKIANILNTDLNSVLGISKSSTYLIDLLNPELYNLPEGSKWQILPPNTYTDPANIKGYILPDDTMTPLFPKHSLVILDYTKTTLENGVFLIKEGEFVQLRRLQVHSQNTISILTENKSYHPKEVRVGANIILAKAISVIHQHTI